MRVRMAVGEEFGRWVVIALPPGRKAVCKCRCGAERLVYRSNLRSGVSLSCGCLANEITAARNTTHGEPQNSPEYMAWANMRQRCSNQNREDYERYGARGIAVCEEWLHDFPGFLAHIGRRPGPGYSIDRIDNERGYEPGNVRWATAKEQAANRRKRKSGVGFRRTLHREAA